MAAGAAPVEGLEVLVVLEPAGLDAAEGLAGGAVPAAGLAAPPSPFSDLTNRVTSASETEEEWPFTGTPSATNFSTVSLEDSPNLFATS